MNRGYKRCWRWQIRATKKDVQERQVFGLGIRVGYWPCLRAPFIQLGLGYRIFELWHGLKSYKR